MSDGPPLPEPGATDPGDLPPDVAARVELLAERYFEELRAGGSPDARALLAAHPDIAGPLERRLALMHRDAAMPAGEVFPTRRDDEGSPALAATRVAPPEPERRAAATVASLFLRCPHCGDPIEVPEPVPPEVLCRGCQATFRVEPSSRPVSARYPERLGKFWVIAPLGQGTFGSVYKAKDPELDRVVAIKVPRPGTFGPGRDEERFLREARSAAQLRHPGIVTVHEIGNEQGLPYIVSDFIDGCTLDASMLRSPPNFRDAAGLIAQLADALDYAHREQVIHRDVKPSNVLLDRAGRPHLADFGLARRGGQRDVTLTLDGQVVGTPAYMAPEQAAGEQARVDGRSDVYSLGVMLYELLTKALPFRGTSRMLLLQVLREEPPAPRGLNDRIPRDLETITLKAMAKEPGNRYQTGGELAADLRRWLAGEPILARPVGPAGKAWRWCRRNPRVAALLGAVALLLVLIAVGSTVSALVIARARDAAELHRRRAEENYQKARAAVDILAQVGGEGLEDVPQMEQWQREVLERALEFYEGFSDQDSADPVLRHETGRAYARVGTIQRMLGRHDRAEEAYRKALAVFERLAAEFPGEAAYRHELAASHTDQGELLRTTGGPTRQAEDHYDRAIQLEEALAATSPGEPSYRHELARAHNNRGILRQHTPGHLGEAAADYDRVIELLRDLSDRPGAEPAWRADLARGHINRGTLHRQAGELKDAEADYGRAAELLEQLLQEAREGGDHRYKVREYRFRLGTTQTNLGNLLRARHRPDDAAAGYRKARALFTQLSAEFPRIHLYRKELGRSWDGEGNVLADAGRYAEAEAAFGQARAVYEGLVAEVQAVPEYRSLLAMSLNNLAYLILEQDQAAGLLLLAPEGLDGAARPGDVLARLAWLAARRERLPEAVRLLREAVERQEQALQPNAEQAEYRHRLAMHYRNLADALVRLGEPVQAAVAAEALARVSPTPGDDRYKAALVLARCARQAAGEERLPAARRDELAREYADRATALLRAAVENGFGDAAALRENGDLAALRGRPDFPNLREVPP
jgi:tetratricopeptide (TPR) repeat protein